MKSQSQNIPTHIEISDDDDDQDMQETHKKSDLFELQMKKIEKSNGTIIVICNYWSKKLKWLKSGGYDTYQRHVNNAYSTEAAKSKVKGKM